MKIVQEQPLFRDEVGKMFRLPEGAIFTYGDVIYNPSGRRIDEALLKHEETHSKQQGNHPDLWWQKYLTDTAFRAAEEVEAYRVQYQHAKKVIHDRNKLFRYLYMLATDLSGSMYGNVFTHSEAIQTIKI